MSHAPILAPGSNCWRVDRAERVHFLIDADAYFTAFAKALERAERSVVILGWDIHGSTQLLRGSSETRNNDTLGKILHNALTHRPGLHVYILEWDFSMLFAFEREWTPLFQSDGWVSHPRLHFRFDATHPVAASHHQKVAVIDDSVAFVGGIDLTQRRWDTPAHRADDERRRDPRGEPYPPVHDVQVMLDGDAARALARLARERWTRASGRPLPRAEHLDGGADRWPESIAPDMEVVPVAVARTFPKNASEPEIREVEKLYLDTIAAARNSLYFENQYFTSTAIVDAIAGRLSEPEGPEVLMVLPRDCPGWLEETTMGLLRARLLQRLARADEHGRFRACYPVVDEGEPVYVHAKVTIADDRMVRVGSSNLSNRSMAFDTECDVAIESDGNPDVSNAITSFRNRLLAEHLGARENDVAESFARTRSLASVVEAHGDKERTLRPLTADVEAWAVLVPNEALIDPSGPEAPKRAVANFVSDDVAGSRKHPWIRAIVALAVLIALASVWRWTPAREWIEPESIAAAAQGIRGNPLAPFLVIGIFVIGTLVMLPVIGLILATALTFDTGPAIAYSLVGSVLSGLAGFAIGHVLARDTVRRLAGPRLNRVSKMLGRGGVLAVVALRVLPVAPYTVANIVAGASHIRWRDFTLGTALGLAPAILAINLFETQAWRAVREPGAGSVLVLVGVLLLIVLGIALARRTFKRLASDEH